jgi:hypothetical protein
MGFTRSSQTPSVQHSIIEFAFFSFLKKYKLNKDPTLICGSRFWGIHPLNSPHNPPKHVGSTVSISLPGYAQQHCLLPIDFVLWAFN